MYIHKYDGGNGDTVTNIYDDYGNFVLGPFHSYNAAYRAMHDLQHPPSVSDGLIALFVQLACAAAIGATFIAVVIYSFLEIS